MTSPNKCKPLSGPTADIRRKLVSQSNLRLLRAFPAFMVDRTLPEKLRSLLERLDEREHHTQGN